MDARKCTDCGVGISAENADRLFNAFFTTKPAAWVWGSRSAVRSLTHGGRLVDYGKRTPRCHVSVHPAGERRHCVVAARYRKILSVTSADWMRSSTISSARPLRTA